MRLILAILLSILSTMSLFARETKEAAFWKWFTQNQTRFDNFELNQEVLLDELHAALDSYTKGLVFELGAKKDNARDFVISADGIEDLFPAVSKLVAVSPKLPGWRIIAFRPRMDNYSHFTLEYGGRKFNPKEIWFHSQIKNGLLDVIFYHPSYRDEDRNSIISGTYILLDMALGEYDVVTGIHRLDHQQLPPDPN